jgi:hypothetical protein
MTILLQDMYDQKIYIIFRTPRPFFYVWHPCGSGLFHFLSVQIEVSSINGLTIYPSISYFQVQRAINKRYLP